jgi:hypothetical protein
VFDESRSYRPIVYRPDSGTELAYANGAVIARGESGGTTMLRRPRMLLSTERTLVPVVNTTLNRRQFRGRAESVDSESRVLVRTEQRTRQTRRTDRQVNLTVEITSPRATAWREYFEAELATSCSQTGDTVTCTYSTDEATVVLTRIAVSFD